MLSLFMTTSYDLKGKPRKLKLLFMDVSRAYLHAPVLREIYVECPQKIRWKAKTLLADFLRVCTERETRVQTGSASVLRFSRNLASSAVSSHPAFTTTLNATALY
jgi:hypothetical protein